MITNELWHRQREYMRRWHNSGAGLKELGLWWDLWWKRLYTLPAMDKRNSPSEWVSASAQVRKYSKGQSIPAKVVRRSGTFTQPLGP